jgi:hypothetical protein
MLKLIVNIVLWNIVWFVTIIGAARGYGYAGPLAAAGAYVIHMLFVSRTRLYDTVLVVLLVVLGLIADTLVAAVGAIDYGPLAVAGPLAPPFMLALWVNFALLLNYALRWMKGRYLVAVVMGAVGGPMAYYTGSRFGAVALPGPLWYCVLVIGLEWALVMPIILLIMSGLERYPLFAPKPRA